MYEPQMMHAGRSAVVVRTENARFDVGKRKKALVTFHDS